MPEEVLVSVVVVAIGVTVWFMVRVCADAALHGSRNWWRRAIYLAQQRVEFREFSKGLDESRELERMAQK